MPEPEAPVDASLRLNVRRVQLFPVCLKLVGSLLRVWFVGRPRLDDRGPDPVYHPVLLHRALLRVGSLLGVKSVT